MHLPNIEDSLAAWPPLARYLLVALALTAALGAIFRSLRRGGIVATAVIVAFIGFGHVAASITSTSSPACARRHAHADPPGPPPAIKTSQWWRSEAISRRRLSTGSGPRDRVGHASSEDDLENR